MSEYSDGDDNFPSQASMASDQEGCCSPHQECGPAPELRSKGAASRLLDKLKKILGWPNS